MPMGKGMVCHTLHEPRDLVIVRVEPVIGTFIDNPEPDKQDDGQPDPRLLAALFFTAIPENLGFRQLRNVWLIASFAKKADA